MDGSAKSCVNTLPRLIYERDSWENISIGNSLVLTDEKCQHRSAAGQPEGSRISWDSRELLRNSRATCLSTQEGSMTFLPTDSMSSWRMLACSLTALDFPHPFVWSLWVLCGDQSPVYGMQDGSTAARCNSAGLWHQNKQWFTWNNLSFYSTISI